MTAPTELRILQVAASTHGGGAERIAWELLHAYRQRNLASWLAVAYRHSNDPGVFVIPNQRTRNPWAKLWWRVHAALLERYAGRYAASPVSRLVRGMAEPAGLLDHYRGRENFHFPGTHHLLDLPPAPPTILHAHNLHHNYFDLRALPMLSRRVPVVLTLHDAWLLSGHCAHSFDCERWRTGCGNCPDLSIYPAVRRDATAFNWQHKQAIYRQSRLHIATPSQWLMDKVHASMLMDGAAATRVIPNGVDLRVFNPGPRQAARQRLGLAPDAKIVLFAANGIRHNPWKDFALLRAAVGRVAAMPDMDDLRFVALGESGPDETIGAARIHFVPYQRDATVVADYYRAADLYIHAARADTFPNTVLEALACGTPVVATAVGGIPEQIIPLAWLDGAVPGAASHSPATGALVPLGDADAMTTLLHRLLRDDTLRQEMGYHAADDAARRFGLDRQADAYLAWYRELLAARPTS